MARVDSVEPSGSEGFPKELMKSKRGAKKVQKKQGKTWALQIFIDPCPLHSSASNANQQTHLGSVT